MYGPDDATAVLARPAPLAAGTPGWFDRGDPTQGRLATGLDPDFLNGLLAEVLSVMSAAGVTPDKTRVDQLLASIKKLILTGTAGGVYRTLNSIPNSQTLPATYCGCVNVITAASVTATLPLAGSVPVGTPIDFVTGFTAVIARQNADLINLDGAASANVSTTPGGKLRLVSDGNSVWYITLESNLNAPNFRSVATGQTPALQSRDKSLVTSEWARNLGFNAAGIVGINVNTTLTTSVLGSLVVTYGACTGISLPLASACVAGEGLMVRNSGAVPMTIFPQAPDTIDGYTTVILLPSRTVSFITDGNAWFVAGNGVGGRLTIISSAPAVGQAVQDTWPAGTYERIQFHTVGVSVAGAGTGLAIQVQRADGTWSAGQVISNSSGLSYDSGLFVGAQDDRSMFMTGGTGVQTDPGFSLGGVNLTGQVSHAGGMIGIRLTTGDPTTYPLNGGTWIVEAG